jgi:drug/metabolite transporter (DMT)-like permease
LCLNLVDHLSKNLFPHLGAVLQALLVTFLWSTSWVLIKIGLEDIPALTFAGLRYSLAFLCLLPLVLRPAGLISLRGLSGRRWARLIVLGFLFYAVTQGAQFLGLAYLPALTVSLLLNFTTIVVALLGIFLLAERPTVLQWSGVCLNVIGIVIYFYPVAIPAGQAVGLIVVVIGVLANAGASILGRHINRDRDIPPLTVTIVSMGVGAIVLLVTGILTQGLPRLSPIHWAIIGWLAVVNTAFAFTLWNHTLRTLSAMESSIINSTMLVQIAILAWLFLGERLTWQEGIGMVLAGLGALIVQFRKT